MKEKNKKKWAKPPRNNKNERQIIYPSYYFFDLIKFIYVIANKYRWKYKIWKRKSYDNRT